MFRTIGVVAIGATACLFSGCGSGGSADLSNADAGTRDETGSASSADAAGDTATATLPDATASDATATIDASRDAPTGVPDPDADGPFPYAERDATTTIPATNDSVAIHVAYPTSAGSYPVVVFGHGLQLAASEYYGYLKRLASFGYVALTVDYPASVLSVNNPNEAKDMLGGVDWVASDATLGPIANTNVVGMSGHSLGGKVALLAATYDPRVKAAFVLDPVDGGGPQGCTAPACVTVAALMPSLHVPTGFVGETTDATGGFMPCAPAADNYTTFYAGTNAPSVEITALGANHMSFLDDVSSCGVTCSFCNMATAPNARVNAMARALMVAFYERHLRGNAAYDAYLTGAMAQSRYVATNEATIASK